MTTGCRMQGAPWRRCWNKPRRAAAKPPWLHGWRCMIWDYRRRVRPASIYTVVICASGRLTAAKTVWCWGRSICAMLTCGKAAGGACNCGAHGLIKLTLRTANGTKSIWTTPPHTAQILTGRSFGIRAWSTPISAASTAPERAICSANEPARNCRPLPPSELRPLTRARRWRRWGHNG